MSGVLPLLFIFLLGLLVVVILYLKTLQDTLHEISDHNRQMPAVNVWLMLIPIFNYIYPFIMYPKISESLRLEFEERGVSQPGDYLRSVGITMAVLGVSGVLNFVGNPFLGIIVMLAGLAHLVLFIIYWTKIVGYKKMLIDSFSQSKGLSGREDLLD